MEWKKYCKKFGKEVTIISTETIFGCLTSLPTTNCCMDGDCIFHNTNFLALRILITIKNIDLDTSSWSFETYEQFLTKNLPNKKNYCMPLPSIKKSPQTGDESGSKPWFNA